MFGSTNAGRLKGNGTAKPGAVEGAGGKVTLGSKNSSSGGLTALTVLFGGNICSLVPLIAFVHKKLERTLAG
jgi:hypothetical protein